MKLYILLAFIMLPITFIIRYLMFPFNETAYHFILPTLFFISGFATKSIIEYIKEIKNERS